MCEAHAFILKDGKEEKFLESVDLIKIENDQINTGQYLRRTEISQRQTQTL